MIPENLAPLPLPPRSLELNPVGNIWRFIRDDSLSNRVVKSYEDILDWPRDVWNQLSDQPWKIMSIVMRPMGLSAAAEGNRYNRFRSSKLLENFTTYRKGIARKVAKGK